jgi:hypothetical protein
MFDVASFAPSENTGSSDSMGACLGRRFLVSDQLIGI